MCMLFFFFKQKTAYEMRISDWSSDVCSSDLSYRIRQMEDVLGVQLFRRRPRGLELTSEGETLQTAVRQGLERLDEAVLAIRRRARTPTDRKSTRLNSSH